MSVYDTLNPRQKEAVFYTDGPLLLLAGAGSGKTRVLIHRIAYLIDEKNVNPWNILAITFTNKAAGEIKERVNNLIGYDGDKVWVSTFHSVCVRMLRRDIDKLGYGANFSIYDTDDQKRAIRGVIKLLKLDPKQYNEKRIINAISHIKEQYISVADFKEDVKGDYRQEKIALIYEKYQEQLKSSNALDFDDILFKTVELFEHYPDVLEYWQERFKYIMVDEYQDTNGVQFIFMKMLAAKYKNVCVVGDDDQSIYGFRGADIRNILDFEQYFPEAKVIKLEQNYRSTPNILNVANSVIHNNEGRMDKTLFTECEEGDIPQYSEYEDNYKEAEGIADEITKLHNAGDKYSDFAVLNRTNAQSRVFEEKFMMYGIPYKIVGGISFYSRMEIRDVIAYMKLINNICDDQAFNRIINVPKRGIGATTVAKLAEYANDNGICLYDAACMATSVPNVSKGAANKVLSFVQMIEELRDIEESKGVVELFDAIIEKTDYVGSLAVEGTEEAKDRIRNVEELKSKIVNYDENAEESNLNDFLAEVVLITSDDEDYGDDAVTVMTIHSAKGLEFTNVFLSGLENGIFPSYMVIENGDEDDLEEERRLFYVAVTRAKKRLYMSRAKRRMINGKTQFNDISVFVSEIDRDLYERKGTGYYRPQGGASKPLNFGKSIEDLLRETKSFENTGYQTSKLKSADIDFEVGDRVVHRKFGIGEVKSIEPSGDDYYVAVEFAKHGMRRVQQSYAKLKKHKL